MTYDFTCPICNKTYPLRNTNKRVFCPCGGVSHNPHYEKSLGGGIFTPEERQARKRVLRCKHRGEELRGLDCGCDGNPKVYVCSIFGECAIMKLSRMSDQDKQSLHFCDKCDRAETE